MYSMYWWVCQWKSFENGLIGLVELRDLIFMDFTPLTPVGL